MEVTEFVLALNPRYEMPCHETLKKFVARVAHETKATIKELMENSGKVTVCADIWTQRNMVASCLAITAHLTAANRQAGECLFGRQTDDDDSFHWSDESHY